MELFWKNNKTVIEFGFRKIWRPSASVDNPLPRSAEFFISYSASFNNWKLFSLMRFQKPPFWHCFWLCASNRKSTKMHLFFFKALINNCRTFLRRSVSSASVCDRLSMGARPDRGKRCLRFQNENSSVLTLQRDIMVKIEVLKQLSVIRKIVFQLTNPLRPHLFAPKRNRDIYYI